MAELLQHQSSASHSAEIAALSESERLLIICLREIARSEVEATRGMSERDRERHVSEAIFDLIQSLGSVSEAFAAETERYLRQAIRAACAH
jgi:hypothetical protein